MKLRIKPELLVNIKASFNHQNNNQTMFNYEDQKLMIRKYRITQPHDLYNCSNHENKNKRGQIKIHRVGTFCKDQHLGRIDFNISNTQSYFRATKESYLVDKGEGTNITEGSVIKIGRSKFRISQINTSQQPNQKINDKIFINFKSLKSNRLIQKGTCKFCLSEEINSQNQLNNQDYLISPCNCRGSCQSVHIKCLKLWLSQKVQSSSTPNVDFYDFGNLYCQICKQQLPISVQINGKLNQLIGISQPKSSFIILEGMKQSEFKSNKSIIIAKFHEKKNILSIGRGNECDIKLNDISVSRLHTLLQINKQKDIILRDCKSKFGTLVELKKNILLKKQGIKVQVGNIYLQMTVNKNIQEKEN